MAKVIEKVSDLHPATLLVLSFVAAILAGAVLLSLPFSTTVGRIPFIDALFTSTSAVCVTGLVVVDTGAAFTRFGQIVILGLIQVGGLGVMTITVVIFGLMGRSMTFRQRMLMQDVFAHTPREDIGRLVKTIFLFTGLVELVGAALLFTAWAGDEPWPSALYSAVFHSISAFCNAGFGLYPDSLMKFHGGWIVNLTVCGLIVLGGIGFPVMYDLYGKWRERGRRRIRLAVQTKTVLWTTAVLIVAGMFFFWFLEQSYSLTGRPLLDRFFVSLFQSITCRTAGFNTVDIGGLRDATLAVMVFLMFFGASPGSTGGGVKTTTLALIAAFSWSRLRGHERVNLFKKSIPQETLGRSLSLILISVALIAAVFFVLLLNEGNLAISETACKRYFLAYFFETVSAFGTVGLSMGVTSSLTISGKWAIIAMMFIGRVGVLTFSYVLSGAGAGNGVEYAEENVMIG